MSLSMQDIEELKTDVGSALNSALDSMDYHLLRTIMDASQIATAAFEQRRYIEANFQFNMGFWKIGEYIREKINDCKFVQKDGYDKFFNKISDNISHYLNTTKEYAFSPENLQRCYKLVELIDKETFIEIAKSYSWERLNDAIDNSNSKTEFFDLIIENS